MFDIYEGPPTPAQLRARKRLIAALRSRKYKQAVGRLRRTHEEGGGMCCQGIGCDISGCGEWIFDGRIRGFEYVTVSETQSAIWPLEVRSWFGFTHADSCEFVNMNDGNLSGNYSIGEPCTFAEIADCMEYLTLGGF